MIYEDGDTWEVRQSAIQECIEDLAEALHSESRNWQQLIEMAGLYRDIVKSPDRERMLEWHDRP